MSSLLLLFIKLQLNLTVMAGLMFGMKAQKIEVQQQDLQLQLEQLEAADLVVPK